MLYIFWNICIFIITIGILITIHELGHFTAARICGVTIQRFSIGFGYVLLKFYDKKNTEYVISAIPLGGYVKMLNKNDILKNKNNIDKHQETFENKTICQRALIIAAGPIFNIIFSFLIYWFIFSIGTFTYRPIISEIIPNSIISKNHIPCDVEINSINNYKTPNWESVQLKLIDIINRKKNKKIVLHTTSIHSSQITKHIIDLKDWKYDINTQNIITALGIIPLPTYNTKPIISKIEKNSTAMKSGLKIGDEIISINNKTISKWETFENEIKNNPNTILKLIIKRNNEQLIIDIKQNKKSITNKTTKNIGILPTYYPISKEYTAKQQFGLIKSICKSGEKVLNLIRITFNMLFQVFIGEIKLNHLGGPLSIAKNAKMAVKCGLIPYLMFLSLISINLGVINLCPLPILDGGYLLLLIIEIFSGKKISEQIEKYTYHLGIILLIFLMCLSIFNDLSKL